MTSLVLLRHGQSIWNRERRFTGWTDVALSPAGILEAQRAGDIMAAHGIKFDVCHLSCLERARKTFEIVRDTMGLDQISVCVNWRLIERHNGALEGMKFLPALWKHNLFKVIGCQLRFDIPPPQLEEDDPRMLDYEKLVTPPASASLPRSESIEQTLQRVSPYWEETIVPAVRDGQRTLIVAHRNSLRALIGIIESLDGAAIMKVRVPTGQPIVYEFDPKAQPSTRRYLEALK